MRCERSVRSAAHRAGILLALAAAELASPGALSASAAPPHPTSSQLRTTGTEPDTAALSAFIASFIERTQIPAAAVSVATADGVVYARGFGNSRGEPVGPDSRFYLGSTTKTLTALGILLLAADGALSLDDAVADLVPGFRLADPAATSALTVRHLLTHASGFSARSAFDARAQREGRLERIRVNRPPGSSSEYSSLNFLVLGQVIEAVSGQSYDAFMRERVFGLLGMRNTFAERSAAEAAGLVQGHTYIFGWPVARTEPEHTRLMVPAGYVVSTANDLGRYLAALLPATDGDTTWRPIPPELRAELFRPWRGGETGVGLSWGITRWNGLRAYTHEGMTPGFYSVLVLLPDAGYGITVLAARNAGPFFAAPADLADGIIRRLAGQQLVTYGNRERWVRWGFLALLVLTIAQAGRHLRRWWRLGRPMALRPAPRVLALLGLDLVLSVGVVVWILRRVAKIPLSAMLEFYPDLGVLLVAAVVIGVPDAAIQAFSRSKEAACTPRRAARPAETTGAPRAYGGGVRAAEGDSGPS